MTTRPHVGQWQVQGDSAEAYERYLVPAIFQEGAEKLVAAAGVQPGDRVLDVGCGTGIVARTAVTHVGKQGHVTGLDLNADMLDVARKSSAGLDVTIDWQQGAAESLPMARRAFDVVLSQQAFQFFADQQAALEEMRRVLAPGGSVAFSVLRSTEHNRTYQPVIDAFRRHGGDDLGTMMQAPFAEWTVERLRDLVHAAGFQRVTVTISTITARFPSIPEFLMQELSSSPLSSVVATMSDTTRDAIARDVQNELADYIDDAGVVHPLETYIVLARN